jgi:hypothetical protein
MAPRQSHRISVALVVIGDEREGSEVMHVTLYGGGFDTVLPFSYN